MKTQVTDLKVPLYIYYKYQHQWCNDKHALVLWSRFWDRARLGTNQANTIKLLFAAFEH
jgi:hypothetical protein